MYLLPPHSAIHSPHFLPPVSCNPIVSPPVPLALVLLYLFPTHCLAILFCTMSPISSHCSRLLALSSLVFHLSFSPSPLYLSPLPAGPHSFIYLSLSVVSLALSPFPFVSSPSLSLSFTWSIFATPSRPSLNFSSYLTTIPSRFALCQSLVIHFPFIFPISVLHISISVSISLTPAYLSSSLSI